jgi:DNA-binding LacI/PurR family transcriptional regulator
MEIAATAAVSALENGFALLLVPSTAAGLPRFDDLAIDGAIVLEPSIDDPYVEHLQRRGIPLVTIGKQPGAPPGAAAIDLRSAETATLLLDHLRAQTAQRIALITGRTRRTSYVESEAEYARFAAQHAMVPVVVHVDEDLGEAGAFDAAAGLMQAHPQIDGILASVDTFAAGTLRALTALGIRVPERVRLATRYDGHRARESAPPLTAVDLHLEDVAVRAIALLLEVMQAGPAGRTVRAAAPELLVRRSTVPDVSRER